MDDGTRLPWRKSRRSQDNTACVEIAPLPGGGMGVRDSKNPAGGMLRLTPQQWRQFTGRIKDGEL